LSPVTCGYAYRPALAGQVSEQARRLGMPDAERLTMTVRGLIDAEQGDERSWAAAAEVFDQMARRFPGHLYEATLARILAVLGRTSEAAAPGRRARRLLRDSQHKEATMNNGATNAVTHPVTPAQIKVAGLAGDLYGTPDGRPPLVLLSGLTYGRDIWQPVLHHLGRIDPGRQVLNLDLPGHGDSPDQLPHTMERIVGLVHEAVGEAGLATPVLAGHSQSGGFASVYAAQYPASGVINVDALPDLWTFVQVIQGLAASCGGDVLEVWRQQEQTFGLHLLPAETREFIMRHSRPTRDLLTSYWEDIFDDTGAGIGDGKRRGRRDHRGRGALPADPRFRAVAGYRRLVHRRRAARGRRGLGGQRHFPHIAHPARFAERLAATA